MKKRPISAISVAETKQPNWLVSMPSSDVTNVISNFMRTNVGEEMRKQKTKELRAELQKTKPKTNSRGYHYELIDEETIVKYKNRTSVIRVSCNSNLLSQADVATIKVFDYILYKAAERAVLTETDDDSDRKMEFPARDVMELFGYTDRHSIVQAFTKAFRILDSMRLVIGNKEQNNGDDIYIEGGAMPPLFTWCDVEYGKCKVYFNPDIPWRRIMTGFFFLPAFYFRLSQREALFLRHLAYRARMAGEDIGKSKDRSFVVRIDTISDVLQLPNPANTKNPGRDIKDVIDRCLETIETTQKDLKVPDSQWIKFEYVGLTKNNAAKMDDFLNQVKLKVILGSDIAEPYIEIAENKNKHVAAEIKKKRGRPPKNKQPD